MVSLQRWGPRDPTLRDGYFDKTRFEFMYSIKELKWYKVIDCLNKQIVVFYSLRYAELYVNWRGARSFTTLASISQFPFRGVSP